MSLWTCGHRKEWSLRFAPGWALDQNDQWDRSTGKIDRNDLAAPIRAQTLRCLHSGGCASKQAAHRLLSGALP
ncbi:MAG TPA: hypothetical protein PLB18_23450, partial [Acidobacteriota bacterium]|nr:hypothetical protein [Acidobacteriota bacterium]